MFANDDNRFGDVLDADADDTTEEESPPSPWQSAEPDWRDQERTTAGPGMSPRAQPRTQLAGERGISIISRDTAFTGSLRSQEPLHIEGEFNGEIIASGDVLIAPGARVSARVQAIRMTVAGSFEGSVACTDRFEALETGVIQAAILSPLFVIHEGATVNGELQMRLEDDESDDFVNSSDRDETSEDH